MLMMMMMMMMSSSSSSLVLLTTAVAQHLGCMPPGQQLPLGCKAHPGSCRHPLQGAHLTSHGRQTSDDSLCLSVLPMSYAAAATAATAPQIAPLLLPLPLPLLLLSQQGRGKRGCCCCCCCIRDLLPSYCRPCCQYRCSKLWQCSNESSSADITILSC
jgi:hypothetical protein